MTAQQPVLGRSRPRTSILDFEPGEIETFLRTRLQGRGVVAAYLFGSFAEGRCSAWSDLDLVIVCPSELPPVQRPTEFTDLFDLGIPVDVLVYTPEEFGRLSTSDTGFWKEFRRTHRQILGSPPPAALAECTSGGVPSGAC